MNTLPPKKCLLLTALLLCSGAASSVHASITRNGQQIADIRTLWHSSEIYYNDFGHYPLSDSGSTWFQKIVSAGIISPDLLAFGTTPDGTWPIDCYDQRLVYETADPKLAGSVVIRCIGRDGIDNQGAGDDLDSRFGPNLGYWSKSRWVEFIAFISGGWFVAIVAGLIMWRKSRRAFLAVSVALLGVGILVGLMPIFCFGVFSPTHRYPRWGESVVAYSSLGVPAAIAMFTFNSIFSRIKCAAKKRRQDRGTCIACGYNLRGELERGCPECGWNRTDLTV